MAKKGSRSDQSTGNPSETKQVLGSGVLSLPDFSEPHLQSLGVCTYIKPNEAVPLIADTFDGDAQFGNNYWLHVCTNQSSQKSPDKKLRTHLHVDVKRQFGPSKSKPSSSIEVLTSKIIRCYGALASLWIKADFEVPVEALPTGGVIQAFLGLSTQAGKHNLAFNGASMKIEDEQLDELRWRLTDSGDSVLIVLDANVEMPISDSYIQDAATFLTKAFQRIVLDASQ